MAGGGREAIHIMKRVFCFILGAALAFSLAACSVVDLDTPKSAELKEQYNFYEKSVANIRVDMSITPEQADDIFIALVSVGANSEIQGVRKVSGKDNTYSVNWSGAVGSREVDLDNGVVAEIRNGSNVLYPLERSTEYLNTQEVENVTALIDGLNADSSRSEYETAQSAYDTLTNSLKKRLPENLVNKLSEYNLSTMTIDAAVDSAIEEAGATKDNVIIGNGVVSIYLKGADNFTNNMVRNGMFIEARDILKVLQGREEITKIALFWSLPLIDKLGNAKEDTVMKIQLEKDTLQSINFDKFDWNNFPDIADDYFEHAALSQ